MSTVTGAVVLARQLRRQGVSHLFWVPGGHIDPLVRACEQEGIRAIDLRHEQSAAHAADGWTRVTGTIGVAVVTAGPGVTGALTGLANANDSAVPMLLIGGRAGVDVADRGPLQELDHAKLVEPVTKWSRVCYATDRLPEYLVAALRHAVAGKPGPVYLDVPQDVLRRSIEEDTVRYFAAIPARPPGLPLPSPASVAQAAELIRAAERPVIIAGNGIRWANAGEPLCRFAGAIQAPVYLNALGRGTVPLDCPMLLKYTRRQAMEGADLIIIAGTPIDFRLSYGRPPLFPPTVKVIQIDEEPTEIGRNRQVDVALVAGTSETLAALTESFADLVTDRQDWLDALREAEAKRTAANEALMRADTVPLHPLQPLGALADLLPASAIVVGDGGDFVTWASDALPIGPAGSWLDPGRFGCLGVGPGFAIAAKLARPESPVAVIMGDGAFGLSGFDFETACRLQLPMVILVGNNGGWDHLHGDVRYDRIVEAFGGAGERVERPDQLRPALERALASPVPYCVDIALDDTIRYGKTSPISGLTPAKTWGGSY